MNWIPNGAQALMSKTVAGSVSPPGINMFRNLCQKKSACVILNSLLLDWYQNIMPLKNDYGKGY